MVSTKPSAGLDAGHPLDPLSEAEVALASEILRAAKNSAEYPIYPCAIGGAGQARCAWMETELQGSPVRGRDHVRQQDRRVHVAIVDIGSRTGDSVA